MMKSDEQMNQITDIIESKSVHHVAKDADYTRFRALYQEARISGENISFSLLNSSLSAVSTILNLKKKVKTLNDENASLKQDLSDMVGQIEATKQTSKAYIDQVNEVCNGLLTQNQSLKNTQSQLTTMLNESKDEYKRLNTKFQDTQKLLEQHMDQIDTLIQENIKFQKQIAENQAEIIKLTVQKQTLINEVNVNNAKYQQHTAELNSKLILLNDEIDALTRECHDINEQMKLKDAQIKKLNKNNEELAAECNKLKEQLEKSLNDNEKISNSLKAKSRELVDVTISTAARIQELDDKVFILKTQNQSFQQVIEKQIGTIASLEDECKCKKEETSTLQQQFNNINSQYTELKNQYEQICVEYNCIKNIMAQKECVITQQKNLLKTSSQELQKLKYIKQLAKHISDVYQTNSIYNIEPVYSEPTRHNSAYQTKYSGVSLPVATQQFQSSNSCSITQYTETYSHSVTQENTEAAQNSHHITKLQFDCQEDLSPDSIAPLVSDQPEVEAQPFYDVSKTDLKVNDTQVTQEPFWYIYKGAYTEYLTEATVADEIITNSAPIHIPVKIVIKSPHELYNNWSKHALMRQTNAKDLYNIKVFAETIKQLNHEDFDGENDLEKQQNAQKRINRFKFHGQWIYTAAEFEAAVFFNNMVKSAVFAVHFTKRFNFQDITDELWNQIFERSNNHLLLFNAKDVQFVVVRRCIDNTIFKTTNNINHLLDKIKDEQTYDLCIVNVQIDKKQIYGINIRKLQVLSPKQCVLELKNPQTLELATLCKTRINNMSACKNLRSLNSFYNMYRPVDVRDLRLTHFSSQDDIYEVSNENMLDVLMRKSKLQFIRVINGRNVIKNMTLKNIEDLEFLSIVDSAQITIDLQNGVPEKIRLINIKQPVQYLGSAEVISKFKQRLSSQQQIK